MATPNPATLTLVKTHNLPGIVFTVARRPGANTFYLGDSDFKVTEATPTPAKCDQREIGRHGSYVTGVALAGNTLLSVGYDGRLVWWDAEKARQTRSVEVSQKWLRHVAASPDGGLAATVGDDMVCRLWEVATGRAVRELRGHAERTPAHFPSMLFTCAFSPDCRHLATADKVGHVVVWEVATGKQAAALEAPGLYTWDPRERIHSIGGVRSVAFSPDGKSLAVGGIGKIGNIDHLEGPARVEVFDWQSGKRTHEFAKTKFKGLVEWLGFHPQGGWLAAVGGANDGFCFFADLAGNKVLREEKLPFHAHCAALDESGGALTVVGHNRLAQFEMKA